MYARRFCVSAGEKITDVAGGGELSELLGELSEATGGKLVAVGGGKEAEYFKAGSLCGFAYLDGGTLLEILPRLKGGPVLARKALCAEFCRRYGLTFDPAGFDPDRNFMEFFISAFANEIMKIVKSGVLSTYASKEENSTSVQGVILFSENMRRNLVHRERVYVRRDVFTSDRAENRIIKAAALKLVKITADPRSAHHLNEALSFLDEVRTTRDVYAEFGRCANARNAKKYGAVLSICRSLFDRKGLNASLGRAVVCAQLYETPFPGYIKKKK